MHYYMTTAEAHNDKNGPKPASESDKPTEAEAATTSDPASNLAGPAQASDAAVTAVAAAASDSAANNHVVER